MKHSVIKKTQMKSPLLGMTRLRPKQGRSRKQVVATILLTSLVDAFSILVIYLIVNTSASNDILKDKNGVQLPMAQSSVSLEEGVVVKIINNQYYINEQAVNVNELVEQLHQVKIDYKEQNKKINLIIQADKSDSFALVNPILVSSAATGFEKIKFAVIPKGNTKL